MVNWTRNRVVNFSAAFAQSYVELLVALDGQQYDQALFLKYLADAGLVNDVSQDGSEEEITERRRKRWDSYLGKIREFGIGFAVDETRKGGQTKRSFWKASDVARDLASGRLTYRQFMALQFTRFQLPRPSMPLQPQAREEIEAGVRIRPLRLILGALDELEKRNAIAYLSADEIFGYLTTVKRHDDMAHAIDAILDARTPSQGVVDSQPGNTSQPETGQASQDIWLNELSATDYIRQLRPGHDSGLPRHIVVRGLSRMEEAELLDETIPLQYYDTGEESINAYHDFFCSSPSNREREVLMMDNRVVELNVPTEARFSVSEGTITGRTEVLGGLSEGSLVLLTGDGVDERAKSTVFEVARAESHPYGSEVSITLKPALVRADGKPISVD